MRRHVTNEEVRNRIQNAIGVHNDLLTMVKKRKLRWYGYISRSSGMAKTILQGTVKGEARRRGRQKEMGIKHQGMDEYGVWRFPEGSGRQGRVEKYCHLWCPNDLKGYGTEMRWEMNLTLVSAVIYLHIEVVRSAWRTSSLQPMKTANI